jgi:nicotinamide phosphoribosyltransferase
MVSHFEDWLMWNWYSCGVATRCFNIKKDIKPAFNISCDSPYLGFAVNDFGYRGGVFNEGAAIGGAAHLVFFDGTDNMSARKLVKDYYGVAGVGASVWATEHSVATVWGPGKGEYEYLKAQLKRAHPDAIVSIVIDSYDADNFMKVVVADPEIRQMIIDRPGRTVFRPDSNDPLTNVCRYSEMLGNNFGYIINGKGYKVLNHNVGIIQGDGMNEKSIPEIYNEYIKTGWSAENFVTGSGGGLHTDGLTRDTDRWAVKVSHVEIDGASVNVQKTPKSDMTKASKAGKLILV